MNIKNLVDDTIQALEEKKMYGPGTKVKVNSSRFRSGRDPGRRKALYAGKIKKMGETHCVVEFDTPFTVKGKKIKEMTMRYDYISPLEDEPKTK